MLAGRFAATKATLPRGNCLMLLHLQRCYKVCSCEMFDRLKTLSNSNNKLLLLLLFLLKHEVTNSCKNGLWRQSFKSALSQPQMFIIAAKPESSFVTANCCQSNVTVKCTLAAGIAELPAANVCVSVTNSSLQRQTVAATASYTFLTLLVYLT